MKGKGVDRAEQPEGVQGVPATANNVNIENNLPTKSTQLDYQSVYKPVLPIIYGLILTE